jgi:C-3',4' desaturase CrtD
MTNRNPARIVVIGAGVGGLSAAAALARAGLDVTVLEAHVYPGGCAGTFYHQGYRFEAGATLAGGFYPGGPMDLVAGAAGLASWPARPAGPALVAHLPDGQQLVRWGDERRQAEHARAFGPETDAFWRWQERTADALWDFALRLPPWPPQTPAHLLALAGQGLSWLNAAPAARLHPALLAGAFLPLSAFLGQAPPAMRLFIDGQLLIAAQTTANRANALYAAAALDLPRRGVVHLHGGIGAIAASLVAAIRRHGGRVEFRQEAQQIRLEQGRPVSVRTRRGDFPADLVIANLPPWNIGPLLGDAAPARLRRSPSLPDDAWGAFMVYVGFYDAVAPADLPLHHQVIVRQPLAEGNTAFLSLSPAWDASRAPAGRRALTLSTHTALQPWWDLHHHDPAAYAARRQTYTDRLLDAAERVLPGLRQAADLILPGTPVTFQRFTRRRQGWVGGFPQTSLFRSWPPRLAPGLWMVGDSIFPGQSIAAVALGGLRVAMEAARSLDAEIDLRPSAGASEAAPVIAPAAP